MKLQKFKEKDNKKIVIIMVLISILILLGIVIIYYSYAVFTDNKEFHVINGTIPDQKYDVVFNYYVNNKSVETAPKDKKYDVTVSCTNGATGSWNYEEWGVDLTNFSKSKSICYIYFNTSTTLASQIINKTKSYRYVESKDANTDLRYVGANPNNYVYFNCSDYNNQTDDTCELWRIVGVFKNIKKGDGSSEELVKIVRMDALDNVISFDDKYINDYSVSTLNKLLNDEYYNGKYKYGSFKNDKTRKAIESVVWNLGSASSYEDTPKNFFGYERGTNVYSGHATTWTGKIALIYASDYGYSSSYHGQNLNYNCYATNFNKWEENCISDNWLYDDRISNWGQWVLTPTYDPNTQFYFQSYLSIRKLFMVADATPMYVKPCVYLSNSINILSGSGTSSSPYKLFIKL